MADRRLSWRSPPRTGARTLWFLSMLFVLPEVQARGWAGRSSRRSCRRRRTGGARDSHGQRPADLERAVRVARDRAADAAPPARRPGRSGTASCRPLPRRRRARSGSTSRRRRDGRPRHAGRRADGARPGGGRLRASRGSRLRPGRGPDRLPVRRRRRPAVGYGYAVGGGPGRADRGSRRGAARPRSIGHLLRTVAPARRVRDLGAGRGGRGDVAAAPGRASGSTASRVLLCWDRPFADFARYVPISPGLL